MKRILPVLIAVSFLLCSFTQTSFATGFTLPDYSQSDWDSYWETVKGDNTQISLTPGADETELNFNWHSDRKLEIPKVRISEKSDMSNAVEFKGFFTLADNSQQTNRVTVTGLKGNVVYWYSYSLGKDKWSDPEFFRTPSSDSFKAILVGDIQCSAGEDNGYLDATRWNTTLNTALNKCPDTSLIISCGDQTHTGVSADEWAATLAPKALRNIPMATCIGNHDHKGSTYMHYVNNPNSQLVSTSKTGAPYYFRYGDVLFVVFNSTNLNVFESYSLAERAITANSDAKWRVAVMHHDIYGTGHHAIDNDNYLLQGVYSAIMDKFEFDICLTGHEHYYGRSYNMINNEIVKLDYTKDSVVDPDGTLYITTASASGKNRVYDAPYNHSWMNFNYMSPELIYSTVEFSNTSFTIETYTVEDDKKIDEYTITKTDFNYSEIDTSENLLLNTNALERILSHFMGEYYVIIDVMSKFVEAVLDIIVR